ncbi:MAG: ATP-binding protein [Nannocystaceae bacterium]
MVDRNGDAHRFAGAAEAIAAAELLGQRQRWALFVVAALALVALALTELFAGCRAELLDLVGRQRVLGERAVKETVLVAATDDPERGAYLAARVGTTIGEWRHGQRDLHANAQLEALARADRAFAAEFDAVDQAQREVIRASQRLIEGAQPAVREADLQQLLKLSDAYSTAVDRFIADLLVQTEDDERGVTPTQALIFFVTTILLVFAALLRPQQRALTQALRSLDARHRELHAQIAEGEASHRKKARFLATMSHELRNPLSGIIGVADLLEHTRLDDVQNAYVDGLRTSSEHLLGLVNNVLDYTRIDSGKLELDRGQVDPRVCVHEVIQITEALAQTKGIDLRSEIASTTPARFIGDATRLRQILLNLVSNAIKFTERGAVTLATAVEAAEGERPYLIFRVSDTGVGVPPERLPSLFDTFTQLDARTVGKHGGSGLGLAIVRRLAKAMEGELTATSTPGRGSTFALRLPFEPPTDFANSASWSRPALGEEPPLEDFASDHPRRILAVEDEPVNRMVLQAMLQELGYAPTMASDGREALRVLDSRAVDLVLMDMRMPELDGAATTRKIRERLGDAAPFIIAVTAAPESEADRTEGFDAYLGKPVTLQRLKDAIAGSPAPPRRASA